MIRKSRGIDGTASRPSGADRGFTLSETIVVVFLIGIVTAIVVNSVQNSIERARMASCMNELRGIQAALWYDSDGGNKAIDPKTFWDNHYSGTKPGPYVLLLDSGKSDDGIAAQTARPRPPLRRIPHGLEHSPTAPRRRRVAAAAVAAAGPQAAQTEPAAPVPRRVPVETPRAASATEPPLISPLRQRRDLL